jgi:hypothetical protein
MKHIERMIAIADVGLFCLSRIWKNALFGLA